MLSKCWLSAALVLVIGPSVGLAQDTSIKQSWLGETVLLKYAELHLQANEDGCAIDLGPLHEFDYEIIEDNGTWLKVRTRGKTGWIAKSNALPAGAAIDYFTRLIEANPRDANALGRRGWAWHLKKERENALEDLRAATALDPLNPHYHIYLANVYASLRDDNARDYYAEAIREYDAAIALDRKNALAFRQKGTIRAGNSEFGQAIRDFRTSLSFDGTDPQTYRGLGDVYYHQVEDDMAINYYKQAAMHDARDASAYVGWGRSLYSQARYADQTEQKRYKAFEDAIAQYTKAIVLLQERYTPGMANQQNLEEGRREYAEALVARGKAKFEWAKARVMHRKAKVEYAEALEKLVAGGNVKKELLKPQENPSYLGALSDFETAITINELPAAYANKALVLLSAASELKEKSPEGSKNLEAMAELAYNIAADAKSADASRVIAEHYISKCERAIWTNWLNSQVMFQTAPNSAALSVATSLGGPYQGLILLPYPLLLYHPSPNSWALANDAFGYALDACALTQFKNAQMLATLAHAYAALNSASAQRFSFKEFPQGANNLRAYFYQAEALRDVRYERENGPTARFSLDTYKFLAEPK